MVDTLDGNPVESWNSFSLKVDGTTPLLITNTSPEPISAIKERDAIENVDDLIFRTIIPSLILEFAGDSVAIDTYSNRSAQVSAGIILDYDDLFNITDTTALKQLTT